MFENIEIKIPEKNDFKPTSQNVYSIRIPFNTSKDAPEKWIRILEKEWQESSESDFSRVSFDERGVTIEKCFLEHLQEYIDEVKCFVGIANDEYKEILRKEELNDKIKKENDIKSENDILEALKKIEKGRK
ncbi:MAG TPA: hypothetical protein PLZ43_13735 [bacterium]|nr:hypothetical protein [bacterium]